MTKHLRLLTLFLFASLPAQAADPQHLYRLSYEDAEGAIGFALSEKGAGEKVAATLYNRKNEALFSSDKPIAVEIRGLQFDKQAARWNASILFVSRGEVISAMPVSGRFEEMVEIPMLKRQVRAGDIIKQEDVEIQDYALARTRSDTLTDMASVVGKSPARAISAYRPIREQEIASPALIKKNGIVQIRYRSPGVEITTTGQALEEGAKGGIIAVRNLASKKLIHATVQDAETVSVISPNIQSTRNAEEAHYAAN